MLKRENKKIVTMLLILIICISSLGFTFAEDEDETISTIQNVFKEAYDDNEVQEAAVELTKPMAKIVTIGFTVFGLVIVVVVFWYGGADLLLAVRGKRSVSKGRIALLVSALVIGIMFFGGGIFDTIGITDRVIVKTVENILNS